MITENNYLHFSSPVDASNWSYKHLAANIDMEQNSELYDFIRYYCQGIHHVYNRKLRFNTIEESIYIGHVQNAISTISEILIPENIITYRYVPEKIFQYMLKWSKVQWCRKGSIIFDKAFYSTTLTKNSPNKQHIYHNYKYLLKIYVPTGTPGFYVDPYSEMNENELLLLPNTKLKVIKKRFQGLHTLIECEIV